MYGRELEKNIEKLITFNQTQQKKDKWLAWRTQKNGKPSISKSFPNYIDT